jgi:serine/threonine protein kinase
MKLEWEALLPYMASHPRWFEDFGRRTMTDEHLRIYHDIIPAHWRLWRRGGWLISEPPNTPAVPQGWKLHVSAGSRTSEETLRTALPVLLAANVHFKFLMDTRTVREANSKSFHRGSSGKFITVYPADIEEFRAVAQALTEALADFEGPYVLSDRRCPGSKVVFYRYGGFATISRLRPDGIKDLMIHDQDGIPVVDERTPYYIAPQWTVDPFGPAGAGELTENNHELADGRFVIEGAIAFSNRGGIYRGFDNETGADVIVREARPGVEVGDAGVDAKQLLRHEYELLTELADTDLYVRPIAFFEQWEHSFLVEEYIEGTHLGHLSISENPLYRAELTPARMTDYYERFRGLWLQVAAAIAAAHERGIILGDLSPTNIMVTPDDRIRVIDLESAFHEDIDRGAGLSTPGMVTRRARLAGHGDRRTDYYAFGGVMLLCVLACHQADILERAIPRRIFAEAAADLDLPTELVSLITDLYTEDAVLPEPDVLRKRIQDIPFAQSWNRPVPLSRSIKPEPEQTARLHERITGTIDGVVRYLHETADLNRADRLFPADLRIFVTNPLSLAYGAYGCLYALHVLGDDVPATFLAWALQRSTAPTALPPGLHYGTSGVAWALSALGHRELAIKILRDTADHPRLHDEPGVATGSAGYGMACLRLWRDTGLTEFLDAARDTAAHLRATAQRDGCLAHWSTGSDEEPVPVGYADGAAGIAMFLLALHAVTGSEGTLALGRAALEFDLAQGEYLPSGVLSFPAVVPEDGKPAPVLFQYWDIGTAGVLTTALRYHHVTGDPALAETVARLLPDVRRKYSVLPQLFRGTAGIGNALLDAYEFLGDETLLGDAQRVASAVLCSAIDREEGIAFPGEQTVRESCDLATGSTGVALFLHRLTRAKPGARTNTTFVLDDLLAGPTR